MPRRAGAMHGGAAQIVRIAGVEVSHAERLVYPDSGIRKGDVAAYYAAVAPRLLAEIAGRPLSLVRCPGGIDGERFFQKHHAAALGAYVYAVRLAEKSGEIADYIHIDNARGLLELVQMNTIEFHVWGAQAAAPERPDRLVFDLDPAPGVGWSRVIEAAREIRARLHRQGLDSRVRLTGGKGVHVVAAFRPGPAWSEVGAFCKDFAATLARERPDRYVAATPKSQRKDRILIDWLRNVRGATCVAGWSLRARTGAPVAMPLRWSELGRTHGGGDYNLARALRRASRSTDDPWAPMLRQRFPRLVGTLEKDQP